MSNKDPYAILGVDGSASDEEIKKAYHALCRKYHPDRYKDEELAAVANEKMTEINAAYDEIQRMRADGDTGDGYSYGGYGYSGTYSGNARTAAHAEAYDAIRKYINSSEITNAYAVLMSVPEEDRGAEWMFLYGCVLVRRGNYIEAGRCFDTACRLDPDNQEYAGARDQLRMHSYNAGNRTYSTEDTCNTGCGNDCCSNICRLACCLRCCCCV